MVPRGSIAIQKVFAKIRKVFARLSEQSIDCPDNLETVWTIQRLSDYSRNCLDIQRLSG